MNTTDIQIIERLARIEEKFDAFVDRADHAVTRTDDHEKRIRTLESGRYQLLGMGSILAVITSLVGSRFVEMAFGH
jgi:hypothetical protein